MQLVSIGCHSSISELVVRFGQLYRARQRRYFERSSLVDKPGALKRLHSFSVDAHGSQLRRSFVFRSPSLMADKMQPMSRTLSPARDHSSGKIPAGCPDDDLLALLAHMRSRTSSQIRRLGDACAMMVASMAILHQPSLDSPPSRGKEGMPAVEHASNHEYPMLFMAATANTMLHLSKVLLLHALWPA
jgi:hypothetical protein